MSGLRPRFEKNVFKSPAQIEILLKLEFVKETLPCTGVKETSEFIAKKTFYTLLKDRVSLF